MRKAIVRFGPRADASSIILRPSTPSLPRQHPLMLLLPLRPPPALAQRWVARRIVARCATLDEIGERLGGRAGDVDAMRAQVPDHARARLRLVQLGGELRRAVWPGVRAVGERAELDQLDRLAQPGKIDTGRGLELGDA